MATKKTTTAAVADDDIAGAENTVNTIAEAPVEEKTGAADVCESKAEEANESKANYNAYCAYIGPTIRGIIQGGTCFAESREKVLENNSVKAIVVKYPLIEKLIVTGEQLPNALESIRTKNGIIYKCYMGVVAQRNGG